SDVAEAVRARGGAVAAPHLAAEAGDVGGEHQHRAEGGQIARMAGGPAGGEILDEPGPRRRAVGAPQFDAVAVVGGEEREVPDLDEGGGRRSDVGAVRRTD